MAANRALTQQTSRRRDDPVIAGLAARARNGDRQAWDALVDRYAPLIWSICRSHQLEAVDAQDAAQNVWLKLVDQLDNIRDPAALPGWLATTTRRECGRILCAARRPRHAGYPLATGTVPDDHAPAAEQDLLAAERHAALREALGHLPAVCQQLLALLIGRSRYGPTGRSARPYLYASALLSRTYSFAAIRAPVGCRRSRWPAEWRPGPAGWLGVGLPWLAGCPSCSRVAAWTCSSTWPI